MNEEKIRAYDELNVDEKEVLDVFRQMKLMSDYNRFRFYNLKVENLIAKYEQLKQLREEKLENSFSQDIKASFITKKIRKLKRQVTKLKMLSKKQCQNQENEHSRPNEAF